MSAQRWQRLAHDLADAGIEATVQEKPYSEQVYGRARRGVTRSVTLLRPVEGLVEVHDKWWSKNPDVWIGWQVHREGGDSIVTGEWPLTKKRSEVVRHVLEALGGEGNQ